MDPNNKNKWLEKFEAASCFLLFHLSSSYVFEASMTGLCPHRMSNPYCECRYLRQETAPSANSTSSSFSGPASTWWQDIPLTLRTQSCCDLLLGKLNRTMTAEEADELSGAQSYYPGRFLYLSDQLPCPRGARLLESDGTCLKLPCCDRTRLQVAQWDYKVRGRCWVLRSHR